MKYELPENHGLSELRQRHLLFRDDKGAPALSDVQYTALAAGVGRGESLLVVSPTSTGKTQIALWAIARSLEQGCNTVYLVTHRALAKQKFEDFKQQLLHAFLGDVGASLVVATGDYVEDVNGDLPSDALRAPLLVATYEKYLALLSASGVPKDMRNTVIVCDEIQLIGDPTRGQNVEVLLTLLRNAGWRQFVGLSAVLQRRDAADLSNWLNVGLVVQHTREKHLQYECWSDGRIWVARSDRPEVASRSEAPGNVAFDPVSVLTSLLKEKHPPLPVIVFCMKKQDTYDLAKEFVESAYRGVKGQLSLAFEGLPATAANEFLASVLEHRVASHNADLTDEERQIVESRLLAGQLDVVFATSTLAAGVNFPLGAAIFAEWTRWDSERRSPVPIDTSEFHNMAGRVGRMGFAHDLGRVIFFAETQHQLIVAKRYLELGDLPDIQPRVQPERFNQLALQLVSAGLCSSSEDLATLVCTTFSALREADRNSKAFELWPKRVGSAVAELVEHGLLLKTSAGRLSATPVGRAIAHSGLLPETGVFLLQYFVRMSEHFVSLLPGNTSSGNPGRFSFLLAAACLCSPEFRPQNGRKPTRFLPYPLDGYPLVNADEYKDALFEPNWFADVSPINAAWLTIRWADGAAIRELEGTLRNLSAGMLRDMYRNLVWVLDGLSGILAAGSDKRVPTDARPPCLRIADTLLAGLSKLSRPVKRFSFRVAEGLPDDTMWLAGLCPAGSEYRLSRDEILKLRAQGLGTPETLMLGTQDADAARCKAFEMAKPSPQAKANWVRDACRAWKATQRARTSDRHVKRAKKCARVDLLTRFYGATGTDFELTFEEILAFLKVDFARLDDRTKTGAPDYVINLPKSPPLIFELKSREQGKLVDYNRAVEVLAASEVHGYKDAFCVTLCQPGVDPSVPPVIASCERLAVVESTDLGEALLRCCEGTLSGDQLYRWLATPGQALAADLPFRQYG